MGKASKKIIDGLKTSKVPAAMQARVKDLIDEANDWDEAQAAEVEKVVRYVCGVGEEPAAKTLSMDFLENSANELLHALSRGRDLDAFDERAQDIIVRARTMYWFWELEAWVSNRAQKFPKEPVFEETLALLRARKLWTSDAEVLHATFNHLGGFVTDDGELTSIGRWMLERIDTDADAVFTAARTFKDGKGKTDDQTSTLYELLIAHRRDLFDALLPKLKPKTDGQKSSLAEVMLEADPKRYEKQAVALIKQVKDAYPGALAAKNLEKFFPGKYLDEVKRLLLIVIKNKDHGFFGDYQGTHDLAATLAWKALGDGALEIWKHYHEENDAVRVSFLAKLEKKAGKEVLPLLVEGLVYPKDPNVEYGHLNHAKYVAKMAALVKKHDFRAHRERIEKAFATNGNKKIREEIDGLLGVKSKKAAAPKVKIPEGKAGYCFDLYSASVVKAALAAAAKVKGKLPNPIERVKLGGFQGEIQLNTLIVEGVGETLALELKVPRSRVPVHIDMVEDDLLEKFAQRHGLDPESDDEVPSWGDMYELPWSALIHSQVEAVEEIAVGLKKLGAKLAKDCKCGVGEDDNFWTSGDGFLRKARAGVAGLPKAQQPDLAAVCFADPKRQRALL